MFLTHLLHVMPCMSMTADDTDCPFTRFILPTNFPMLLRESSNARGFSLALSYLTVPECINMYI